MKELIENNSLILIEAAIVERLRRADQFKLHPDLANASFIYDRLGRSELEKLYRGYVAIALKADTPILLLTPTWRANVERVMRAGASSGINADAVAFMSKLRDSYGADAAKIKIGGLIGCKNDCYLPEGGLSESEAEAFHAWQISDLAEAGVDFLMASTLPNVNEATGIAKAMEKTTVPYIMSFVIGRNGSILDGTRLNEAVRRIDMKTSRRPLCYMVNCSYPTFLNAHEQPRELFTRLLGFQANASSLSHSELDGAVGLHSERIADWANDLLKLKNEYGLKILGGCCGTDERYLQRLVV